jgi:hypothetical protein
LKGKQGAVCQSHSNGGLCKQGPALRTGSHPFGGCGKRVPGKLKLVNAQELIKLSK